MLRVQATWVGVGPGICYTNLHFEGGTSVEAQQAATKVENWFIALSNMISAQCTFTINTEVLEIDAATGDVDAVHFVDDYTQTGVENTGQVTNVSQAMIRWRTAGFRGARRIKGRTFIPFMVTSASENGQLSAPTILDIESSIAALLDTAGGAPQLVIWSRPFAGVGATGLAPAVVDGSVWNEWAFLSSRRS